MELVGCDVSAVCSEDLCEAGCTMGDELACNFGFGDDSDASVALMARSKFKA